MRIRNPNRITPTAYQAHKVQVLTEINGSAPADADLSFADVRRRLAMTEAQLPDGHIHQIALDAGLEVSDD